MKETRAPTLFGSPIFIQQSRHRAIIISSSSKSATRISKQIHCGQRDISAAAGQTLQHVCRILPPASSPRWPV